LEKNPFKAEKNTFKGESFRMKLGQKIIRISYVKTISQNAQSKIPGMVIIFKNYCTRKKKELPRSL